MSRHGKAREVAGDERAHRRVCALFDACREAGTLRGTRAAALVSVIFGSRLSRLRAVDLPVEAYDPSTGALRVPPGGPATSRCPGVEGPRSAAREPRIVTAVGGAREVLDAWRRQRGGSDGPLFCRVRGSRRPAPDRPLDPDAADRILRWWAFRRAGLGELDVRDLRRRYRSPWWRSERGG